MSTEASVVLALLGEADPEARRRAAQRIAQVEGADGVSLLARALADPDWRVRKEAAAIAASVEPRAEVTARLIVALNDRENVGLRNAAVEALVTLGRDSVPGAVSALASADADARKLIVEVLGGVPDLAGTRALAQALSDGDSNVRTAAVEALGTAALAGEEARALAITALTAALSATEPLQTLAALDALGQLEANLPWAVYEPLTAEPLLRRHAVAACGRSDDPSAVAALARATGDSTAAVAREALIALARCLGVGRQREDLRTLAREAITASPDAEPRIRGFAGAVDDPRVRGSALVVLGLLRAVSDVPELVRALEDPLVSEQAELGLAWFGAEAVPSLLAEGRTASPRVRAATLSLIPPLDPDASGPILEALREASRSAVPDVVIAALQAIGLSGAGTDLPYLASYATRPDARVAATACDALSTLAARHPAEARALAASVEPVAEDAVVGCLLRAASRGASGAASADDAADISFLRGALDHGDVRVRRAAVEALSAIGGPTASAVVARALADEEREVVLAAVRALGRFGQSEPLLALLEGVHDTVVVAASLRALGEASPGQAFDAARPLLRSEDPLLASSAVEAIGQLRGARRDEGLFVALDHPDAGVVKSALIELSRSMTARTLARVGLCLDHPSYEVRRFAAELLGGEHNPAADALVRARLDRETDPVVREALTRALSSRSAKDGP